MKTMVPKSIIWMALAFSVAFEAIGMTLMKLSERLVSAISILMLVCFALSLFLCTYVVRRIDLSVAYPVWNAAEVLVILLIGVCFLGESLSSARLVSLVLLVLGITGLYLTS